MAKQRARDIDVSKDVIVNGFSVTGLAMWTLFKKDWAKPNCIGIELGNDVLAMGGYDINEVLNFIEGFN